MCSSYRYLLYRTEKSLVAVSKPWTTATEHVYQKSKNCSFLANCWPKNKKTLWVTGSASFSAPCCYCDWAGFKLEAPETWGRQPNHWTSASDTYSSREYMLFKPRIHRQMTFFSSDLCFFGVVIILPYGFPFLKRFHPLIPFIWCKVFKWKQISFLGIRIRLNPRLRLLT